MDDPGNGSPSASPDIGCRARKRARCGKAAEQGGHDVGRALRKQFGVGAMRGADHAVGDDRGHKDSTAARRRWRYRHGSNSAMRVKVIVGNDGKGRPWGSAPKRE